MTLQDFKDQVAREYGYENFEDMYSDMIHIGVEDNLLKEIDRAAELHAKEREKEASPKWIPVTESLPEVEGGYNSYSVLIYTEETYTWTGYYNHWKEQWFSGTEKVIVTHWMKIPERP